ncbi:primary-amine oxidase [Natronococcus sp. A-GB1]|uniref:primary-amine oxidase n=1 Tax=Natronococcus sp. A-GB1 TaxID=3037648 RepID=UPI00241DE251|nr:primary-amine oxidase [Natronococcus sp. A-GB1]MDG5761289.1 primary-amine oxidase [Natronococcus sp. A-GB1]
MALEHTPAADHPLDPLSPEEIESAYEILTNERELGDSSLCIKIELAEPAKDELAAYDDDGGDVPDRRARIVIRDGAERKTIEAVVSPDDDAVVSWEHVEGAQPSIAIEEFIACEETVKENEEWQAALERRGIEHTERAMVDPWSVGHEFVPEGVDRSKRLAHGLTFLRPSEDDGDEGYAKPVTGVHTFVDLDRMEVVEVVDYGPPNDEEPLPPEGMAYREDDVDLRDDLTAYNVDQPNGPSWSVEGQKLEWQGWHMRVGWTQREGLVLYNIGYEDDGEVRSIIDRASCAEMSVPYGTADINDRFKNAMDVGEYNIGRLAKSLTNGCDCLGHMHYWDAVMNTAGGDANVLENAICLHEEDNGTLWERSDWRTGSDEVRRRRRLVVSFVAAVGNYDYIFNWYFYQDASMEVEVRLTGIDSVSAVGPDDDPSGYGELVAPQLSGPIHQHFFNFRLDVNVDDGPNTLYRVENQQVPAGPDGLDPMGDADDRTHNPGGNAFYATREKLASETAAKELIDPLKGRYWQVVNLEETNRLGKPTGYRLMPGGNVEAAVQNDSSVMKRSGFIKYHLWATPFREDERYPSGRYPNQHPGGAGLPAWTAADRDLEAEDLVLWYTLGVNHVTRPEDWPILPVQVYSFKLQPVNFFEESPAIDVPPQHAIEGQDVPGHGEGCSADADDD